MPGRAKSMSLASGLVSIGLVKALLVISIVSMLCFG
jgi:hypothetical protein